MGSSVGVLESRVQNVLRTQYPMMISFVFFTTSLIAANGAATAADVASDAVAIFEHRCVSCHNAVDRKGGLSLSSHKDMLAGGDSGPVLVANKPAESALLHYVTGDKPEMPKMGPPLTAQEVETLKQWIAAGANLPKDLALKDRAIADSNWWSLQPIRSEALPQIRNPQSQIRNPIDVFIVAKLFEHHLGQSSETDKRTLIRRLCFDLIGLPPSPDEVDDFVASQEPDAYERLVDRLLASPQHGERWARHWLDVVHYGETHGYDKDKPRPNAWRYRDYVIRAFNEDKPYGRFIEEQIAGDVIYPGTADGIEALGFIAAGPWDFIGHAELPETKIDGKIARHLDRDDMVSTTMGTFNSLTVGCAQCHNHKFDPIAQEDYYRLQAVFAAVDRADKLYDRDSEVARQRKMLQEKLATLHGELAVLDRQITARGGPELAALDRQIAGLIKAAATKEQPEFGYHSAIEDTQAVVKWVQVDLGQPQPIQRLEYVACHDDFAGIGAGFGFPLRYKIEVADDPEFAASRVIVDQTAADYANPGVAPVAHDLEGVQARYVRFTATKLARRLPTDYVFALAELSVFDAAGKNLAAGAAITSLDSIEAPPRWRRSNLVDGYFYGIGGTSSDKLATLRKERSAMLDRATDSATKARLDTLRAEVQSANAQIQSLPPQQVVYAGTVHAGSGTFIGTGGSGGKPRPIHVLQRGDVKNPGPEVSPAALSCLSELPGAFRLPADHSEGERRAALARWISDGRNPLTWRSIANRVWQYHLGRGIVDTPNDFGRMGSLPTHPELVDWLAVDLRDHGGSLKRLHRLIVTSHTYRQTSAIADDPPAGEPQSIDADNRFFWRANRRRLEAEAIRDAVLSVAGRLDKRMGGQSFEDFVIEHPEHSPHYEYHLHDPNDPKTHRRSIYRFIVRSQPQPLMSTLDCADPSIRVDKRNESLSALQALAMLNNDFLLAMSEHGATRISSETSEPESQARLLIRTALNRDFTDDEQSLLAAHIREHGLASACRLIFNLNEFAFVD